MSLFKRIPHCLQLLNTQNKVYCGNYTLNRNSLIFNLLLKNKYCFSTTKSLTSSEKMIETLKKKFPLAKKIEVVDVSGGCGSMYEIHVESVEFKGLSIIKQHRLINEILKDEIKQMHGLRILTEIPKDDS